MDSPWRYELYSPSSSCELATYQVLQPELLQVEIDDLAQFTQDLALYPYDPEIWLNRAQCLRVLGFPELGLGDAHKARLLVEAALSPPEDQKKLGRDAINTFSKKVYAMHASNPAWAVHVDSTEKLKERTNGMLRRLEVQCWTELMEGLMAANCSKDYLDMSKEAVARFPDDEVFPSEVNNAENWYAQRVAILQASLDSGDLEREQLQSTLSNGGVYPTPYPWIQPEFLERDSNVLASIKTEFAAVSTNCTAERSTIRNTAGEEIADVLGVIATKPIKKGETVIVDRTFASVVGSTSRCPTCCGAITSPTTNSCCDVTYCSDKCAQDALRLFHKPLCLVNFSEIEATAESATQTTDFAIDALLLIRVLALSINENRHPLQNSVLARLTPSYGGPSARLIIFNYINHIVEPTSILQKLGVDVFVDTRYDTWVLQTIRCRLQNNKHGQTLDGVCGTAVSDLYSMFNHSCEANVDWRHDENSSAVWMYTKRDVVMGEELFISYIEGKDMGRKERVGTLMPWFGTDCRCDRCEREKGDVGDEVSLAEKMRSVAVVDIHT